MPAKNILFVVAALTLAALALSSTLRGHLPRSASEWLTPIGPAVAVAGAGLAMFNRWVWHFPLIRKLHGRPVLRGTWQGELASDWVDPETSQRIPPIPDVFLVVRQTFWTVSVRLITKESKSYSLSATLKDTGDGVYELAYLYANTPRVSVRDRSEVHYGATVLAAPADRAAGLEGHSFTDRSTRGEMRSKRHFSRLVETHDAALKLLPER